MDNSRITEIVHSHAQGDEEFIEEFAHLCSVNYLEFMEGMKSGIAEQNPERLRKVRHKIKSLNNLFELAELESLLIPQSEDAEFFIKNPEKLRKVEEICSEVIIVLKSMKK